MKKVLAVIAAAMVLSGCASMSGGDPVEVRTDGTAFAAGVNPAKLDGVGSFLANNWGKLTTAALATGAVIMGEKNDWWKHGDGNNTDNSQQATTSYSVNVTDNSGTVMINVVSPDSFKDQAAQ